MEEGLSFSAILKRPGVYWVTTTHPTEAMPEKIEIVWHDPFENTSGYKFAGEKEKTIHCDGTIGALIITFENFWEAYAYKLRIDQQKGES